MSESGPTATSSIPEGHKIGALAGLSQGRLCQNAGEAGSFDAAGKRQLLELRDRNEQLKRAPARRAVIDRACGMVMAMAPCSSERAWDLLVDVSQHCNDKLRDVALCAARLLELEHRPGPPRPQSHGQ
ncbi:MULTISPECIES: ANTAR domain-containing protein [unclassified Streptomyces]|uniref:ANTAR domain-containing protein n=1 Tax=unclassified Streptomyces TaxID=2593676 RepID=UPI002E815266|nr:ANTAR domain-containing protein [Streptomyces sp. NBC_00589]WTI34408.1 ANTAR domain-containing protein [Streptomyces sp. NBC_00775]WUB31920.1 ANTAR domain-containing protein [Streptomyces sp. NBC_00589]